MTLRLAGQAAIDRLRGYAAEVGEKLRALLRPRLGVALFSVALLLSAFDVSLTDIRAAALNPSHIYRALDTQAQLAYAHGVRFVNDLRVVYAIGSQLHEVESKSPEPPAPACRESSRT
ncbi:MAG: hypothetical protein ACE5HL_05045 [Terriglobia bacterium]